MFEDQLTDLLQSAEIQEGALELAAATAPDGLICEFGVARGDSIRRIANAVNGRRVYGFDSFKGLPEQWGKHPPGTYACPPPNNLPANVRLEPGLFSDTLPKFFSGQTEPVAFAHIDCDLYSSTKCVLDHLEDRLADGAILVFDEMFNYPYWRHHEFKAFCEWIGPDVIICPLPRPHHQSAVMRIDRVGRRLERLVDHPVRQ